LSEQREYIQFRHHDLIDPHLIACAQPQIHLSARSPDSYSANSARAWTGCRMLMSLLKKENIYFKML